ncbi:MAG: DUF1223 domain-containing protein [Gammaproteobacteria bacterium]
MTAQTKARLALCALLWCARAGADLLITSADAKTPLVELYTSEGCSSCPPADDWLRALGESLGGEVRAVPLAFHVDYWNYLGWRDPFSKPAFTARQRRVAANNRGRVYTPALVVDGRETRRGRAAVRAIQAANAQPAAARIVVRVMRSGDDQIETRIELHNHSGAQLDAFLAVYENKITRNIGAGENRGRTLRHDFVVRHWSAPMRMRRGENHARIEVAIPADWRRRNLGLAVVALARDGGTVQAVNASLAALFSG